MGNNRQAIGLLQILIFLSHISLHGKAANAK